MSGIEEAYAKYAKGLLEHKLNCALDRLDNQTMILAKMHETIQNVKEKVEVLDNQINGDDEEKEDEEERSIDAEIINGYVDEIQIYLGRLKNYIED